MCYEKGSGSPADWTRTRSRAGRDQAFISAVCRSLQPSILAPARHASLAARHFRSFARALCALDDGLSTVGVLRPGHAEGSLLSSSPSHSSTPLETTPALEQLSPPSPFHTAKSPDASNSRRLTTPDKTARRPSFSIAPSSHPCSRCHSALEDVRLQALWPQVPKRCSRRIAK